MRLLMAVEDERALRPMEEVAQASGDPQPVKIVLDEVMKYWGVR